jgi:hypothetical protein
MPVKSVFRPNLGDLFDVTASAGFASPLLPATKPSNTPQRAFPFLPSPMGRARDVVMESGASSLLAALSPAANATAAPADSSDFTFSTPKQVAKSPVRDENAGVNTTELSEPACDTPPLLLNTPKAAQPAPVAAPPPAAPPAPAASPAAVPAPAMQCEAVAASPAAVVEAAPAVTSEAPQVEEVKPVANAMTPAPPRTAPRRRGATPAARARKAGNSGEDESEDVEPADAAAPLATPARVTRSSARAAAAGAAVTPAAPAAAPKTPKTGGRRTAGKAQRLAVLPAADVPPAADTLAAVTARVATAFKDPYSEEALAELMSNPSAAFKSGPKAMQNSPVQAPPAGRTPRAARKKTAEERHAECWVSDD